MTTNNKEYLERREEYKRSMKMLDKFERDNTAWANRQKENQEKKENNKM